jgi:hypothetical protein
LSRQQQGKPFGVTPGRFSLKWSLEVMQFTIHASKDGETIETHRTSPVIAVAQARMLDMAGWQVQITDRACRQYQPEKFEQLLSFDRKSAISSRAKRSRQRA